MSWNNGANPYPLYIRIAMRLDFFCAPITSHGSLDVVPEFSHRQNPPQLFAEGSGGTFSHPSGVPIFRCLENIDNLHILLRVSTLLFRRRYTGSYLPTCTNTLYALEISTIAPRLSPDPICSATVHPLNPFPNSRDTPSFAS